MTIYLYSNDAKTLLTSAITTTSQTTINITTGSGSLFPDIPSSSYAFFITVVKTSDPSYFEIMKVTAKTSNSFTVERGQQGISAKTFAAGSYISQDITAGDMDNFIQKSELTQILHPPIGTVIPLAYTTTTAPNGFLLCNGASYSISTYPDLFNVIGYWYGGIVNMYFNVPDLVGRFVQCVRPNGSATGVGDYTYVSRYLNHQIQKHEHTVSNYLANTGGTQWESGTSGTTTNQDFYTTSDPSGETETRPVNMAFQYYIRYTYSF